MWIAELRDQVQGMAKELKELDRRLKVLEQVAFGDGKPKKKAK